MNGDYFILKSEVADALSSVLDTIPGSISYQNGEINKDNDNYNPYSNAPRETIPTDPNQNTLEFNSSDNLSPSKGDILRARDYVTKLAEKPVNNQQSIATENIWQIHKKYIVSEVNSGLVIIDQHVAHERILYEDALKALVYFNGIANSSFPETLEFSPDDFDALFDVLPY